GGGPAVVVVVEAEPGEDLLVERGSVVAAGRPEGEQERRRADLEPVAVTELGLLVAEQPAVEQGPVGRAEVADPGPGALGADLGVAAADRLGRQADPALRGPADDQAGRDDR